MSKSFYMVFKHKIFPYFICHYNGVTMGDIASEITSLTIVY